MSMLSRRARSTGTRTQLRQVGEAMVGLCREEPPDTSALPVRLFLDQVRRHRLAPLAHVVLRRAGDDVSARLRPDLEDAVGAHARNLAALRRLSEDLGGLRWAVLKGPLLSELAHPVPGIRGYADIDVLVAPAEIEQAVRRLNDGGWRLLDRHHALVLRRMPGQLHLMGPYGAQVDLHWSLINERKKRAGFPTRSAELLERRQEYSLSCLALPGLEPPDMMLHLCLHAALTGADRLLWLVDVDRWWRRGVDDELFVRRAEAAGAATACALVLGRARRVLDTPVEHSVLRALGAGGWWRQADGVVAAVMPIESLHSDRSLPRLIARSTRASSAASAREACRHLIHAAGPRGPEWESTWQELPDPASWQAFIQRARIE